MSSSATVLNLVRVCDVLHGEICRESHEVSVLFIKTCASMSRQDKLAGPTAAGGNLATPPKICVAGRRPGAAEPVSRAVGAVMDAR